MEDVLGFAPLGPSIDGYVDPTADDQAHTRHLNAVVLHVHRGSAGVTALVEGAGAHLTSADEKVRERGTMLVAEVLQRAAAAALPAATGAGQQHRLRKARNQYPHVK